MRMNIWKRSLVLLVVITLLLTASPWLVPASANPPPESKIGSSLSLRLKLKTEQKARQDAAPAPAVSYQNPGLEPLGISGNLDSEKIFIRFSEKPTESQLAELAVLGVKAYPDSWIPPVGEHKTGFILAETPIDRINTIAAKNWVVKINTAETESFPQNDLGRAAMGVDSVWTGGNKGAGVTVAVLDSGIDVTNPDFPTLDATNSQDYCNYPTLDDPAHIDIANSTTGHGTHVAASVLGLGVNGASYKGVAPEADLVFLKIGGDVSSSATDAAITGAIHDAVSVYHADIITMSYGGWSSFHDGTDEECQAVDWAVSQGVTVFISAGNNGARGWHYSETVEANDTTDFIQINLTDGTGYDTVLLFNLVWYDGPGTHNGLSLKYYDSAQNELLDIEEFTQQESDRGTEQFYSYYNNDVGDGTYYLKVQNASGVNQPFHLYYNSYFNQSGAATVRFENADPYYTLGRPADADGAIAVGAYVTRTDWTDYLGVNHPNTTQIPYFNDVAAFSSRGPRVDNGAPGKPNILAPGSLVVSARDNDVYSLPSINPNADIPSYPNYIIDNDGNNLNGSGPADYLVMQGTSMACPLAAGVGALILSAHPDYTPLQVKYALESTASKADTGRDNDWGWGLINAAEATGNSVEISVVLQDDTNRPDSGWIVPLTVKFFTPGANVLSDTPLYSFTQNTTKDGSTAVIQCEGIVSGIYDITAVSSHTLINVKRNVTINASTGTVDLGTLLEGNANNDVKINIFDFRLLSLSYGSISTDPDYDEMADFNMDGTIDINDFALLVSNYGKRSPITVP